MAMNIYSPSSTAQGGAAAVAAGLSGVLVCRCATRAWRRGSSAWRSCAG